MHHQHSNNIQARFKQRVSLTVRRVEHANIKKGRREEVWSGLIATVGGKHTVSLRHSLPRLGFKDKNCSRENVPNIVTIKLQVSPLSAWYQAVQFFAVPCGVGWGGVVTWGGSGRLS